MSIKSEIIADSINPCGNRLTTFILRFPRIVLSELNTHRVFSKNSASSRAIPFEKMLEMVKNDPFIPIKFQKDHKGMQGNEYYEEEEYKICAKDWLNARDSAIKSASNFKLPITKQLRNRLLEPFMWHRVILSGTNFENFFALRAHPDAEIHICELAYKMLDSYNKSEPKKLKENEWHIPFGDKIDSFKLLKILNESNTVNMLKASEEKIKDAVKKISIARCARISYFNYEGKDDYEADIKLCDRLFGNNPKHLSPTEHVAMAMGDSNWYGNFCGFKQFRKFFNDENLKDTRVIKNYKEEKVQLKDSDAPNYEKDNV
jgi:thymidylate synthase ThyX